MMFWMGADAGSSRERTRAEGIDEGLLARIGNEDAQALGELYRVTERAVYALALSIVRDVDMTQDVVQETYLKIRAAAHLYRPQGKPLAWIFTITKHLAFDALRARRGEVLSEEGAENDLRYASVTDPTDRLVLEAAMNGLDEGERQVILLHVVSGLTHREIAGSMGAPLSTVLSRYHRALHKLRRQLSEKGGLECADR